MAKIKITCDSTCDLTKALYEENEIQVISLGVVLGEDLHRDGVDVDAEQIFRFVEQTGVLPKTSAISVGEYMDVFDKWVKEGYAVVHINISSELSACHQNACLAAQNFEDVYVVDSRNLSTGSGHLVLAACGLANSGMEAAEIAQSLNEMKQRLDVSFVLQTLEYLHKGGRCSGVAAFGANVLKLRPEIEVKDGKMQVGKKYRGSADKSISDYIKGRLEGRTDLQLNRIFVTHTELPEKTVTDAIALVKQLQPFAQIIETTAGCTISSHCGPGCLGILFFKK